MRERSTIKVNQKTIVGIVAVILLIVTWAWILKPAGSGNRVWFYDLDAAALYPADKDERPPATAPSGGIGVRAQVYTCTTCDESQRFVGYLEKYTDQAKAAMQNPDVPIDPQVLMEGHLVRAADGGDWTPHSGSQGEMIARQATSRCPAGKTIQTCLP